MRRRSFLALAAKPQLSLATFEADITPPVGTPLCIGLIEPGKQLDDPLKARGVVLRPAGDKPIVLCALDWIAVGNTSQDRWKSAIAKAVGTEPARVLVHTVHQHDAPGEDMSAEEISVSYRNGGVLQSTPFARKALDNVVAAVRAARPQAVSHYGVGAAKVDRVASNRRIMGDDGKVIFGRMTACRNSPHCAAPEGVIDPFARTISFWSGDRRVATLAYYASHPMSYYAKGGISADFPGMARAAQDNFTVYFTGAGANIGAGKYNDGAVPNRAALAERLGAGIRAAVQAEQKHAVEKPRLTHVPTALPVRTGAGFSEEDQVKVLEDTKVIPRFRANASRYLAWLRLRKAGRLIDICGLHLGAAHVLHMPGELFVEYQLASQKELRNEFVTMAAYGDYGPMYIGTARAYAEGGYETGPVSRVAPEVEEVLLSAQRKALRV